VIDPRHVSLIQWTDAVNLALSTKGPVTKLSGDDWSLWAYNMISIPSIASFSPPDPRHYTDWRTWAERFVECVLL
jgi:hypothetical protein